MTIVIIPASADPRPWPSFGLRERVREYVEARACAGVAGLHRVDVTGPRYLAIDVDANDHSGDANDAGAVESRVRETLARLLHPLYGGREGGGWAPGRDVFLSDIAAVVERVDGVDYVESLAISVEGRIGGEHVAVSPDRTVVAGTLRLKLTHG